MRRKRFVRSFFWSCRLTLVAACVAGATLLGGAGKALADPLYIGFDPGPGTGGQVYSSSVDFYGTGVQFEVSYQHNDNEPYKGSAVIAVTNRGTQSWGDFHFQVFSTNGAGWSTTAHVFFGDKDLGIDGPYAPVFSTSPGGPALPFDSVNATPGTGSIGAVLDLYFDSHPLLPNQTAFFTVYTDNTTDGGIFGLTFYPSAVTPVPLPGALLLLAPALAGLGTMRRRFGKGKKGTDL